MVNIGIIHPSFRVLGGAENTTMCIINLLKKTTHFTTLYTVEPPEIEETRNFRVHRIGRRNFPSLWKYQRIKEVQQLFKDASSEDILVISSGGLTLEKTSTKKAILYCHSTFEGEYEFSHKIFSGLKGKYYNIIQNNVKNSFEMLRSPNVKLVSNSNYTKKRIEELIQKDSKVIYPPVDIKKFSRWFDCTKNNKIVTLSRFSPEKNLEFAMQVIKSGNFNYELIGNAKFESQMKIYHDLKSIDSKNISISCNLSNTEIENALGSAKVYFHPSKETFGISVVEAVSAGCIPIVPDNFAFAETIPVDSLRFKDKEDAINKLRNAIEGKYDHLRSMLRLHIEKFSVENFQNELLEEIESIS